MEKRNYKNKDYKNNQRIDMKKETFSLISKSPVCLPHPKGCGLFGLLDAQRLNLKQTISTS